MGGPISCHVSLNFVEFRLGSLQGLELEAKDVAYQGLHVNFHLQERHLEGLGHNTCGHMLHNLQCWGL